MLRALVTLAALLATASVADEASWRAVIVADNEPGERLLLSGTVYAEDASTPLAGIKIHVHNTNARGVYARDGGGETGRIEGSVVTDERGRYEILTVKPASYPGRGNPAHVHFLLTGPDGHEQRATLHFTDDPLISEERKQEALERGAFGTVRPVERGEDGVWRCSFDLRLVPREGRR